MTEWAVILTPLLVLPIVLLFRFVGCGLDVKGTADPDIPLPPRKDPPAAPPATPPLVPTPITTPPNYRGYILGEFPNPGMVKNPSVVPNGADVVAYWRLVDAPASVDAKDEKNVQKGTYQEGQTLPAIAPTATTPGSKGQSPAHFVPGQNSLIASDPTVKCRRSRVDTCASPSSPVSTSTRTGSRSRPGSGRTPSTPTSSTCCSTPAATTRCQAAAARPTGGSGSS